MTTEEKRNRSAAEVCLNWQSKKKEVKVREFDEVITTSIERRVKLHDKWVQEHLGGGKGRNASAQITPHTNRLLSTLSEPITCTNSHPDVCPHVFLCLCVGRNPHHFPSWQCARCLLYNRLLYLLHMLSQVSLLSLFLIFKCLYLDSDENWEVTSAYPVSRQAPGHVQNHCGLVLLHFLNWNHLVREKERQEDKRWDLRIDPKLKNKTKKQQYLKLLVFKVTILNSPLVQLK